MGVDLEEKSLGFYHFRTFIATSCFCFVVGLTIVDAIRLRRSLNKMRPPQNRQAAPSPFQKVVNRLKNSSIHIFTFSALFLIAANNILNFLDYQGIFASFSLCKVFRPITFSFFSLSRAFEYLCLLRRIQIAYSKSPSYRYPKCLFYFLYSLTTFDGLVYLFFVFFSLGLVLCTSSFVLYSHCLSHFRHDISPCLP